MDSRPKDLTLKRNTQLDGWRAIAVLGVMWHHWAPPAWKGPVPFYAGLFFFLTLSGFFITRNLLRERAVSEEISLPNWRRRAYFNFQRRRLTRILIPCYVAMLFAIAVGSSDIRAHPLAYFTHVVNFHMAKMEGWPSGTAHYWTLAIQMQFYLLWPLLVLWIPKRALGWVFVICVAVAPISRFILLDFPSIQHAQAITLTAFDYFGIGGLFALALEKNYFAKNSQALFWLSWLSFIAYLLLYSLKESGNEVPVICFLQQTFLAIAFAGLICATLNGFENFYQKLLDHPALQHIGRISYGLYLFHTPMPLFLGWVMPFLWHPVFDSPLMLIRIGIFALFSWGAAWLCWRWLEGGRLTSKR